ncbi:hypothetical protein Q8F55_001714 [Vanrija albida]|uniref:Uncharacterized protein n=1 Tax=Vanrija albida TaxID=181172 RepID=A0ABR3Q7Z4_9TREE
MKPPPSANLPPRPAFTAPPPPRTPAGNPLIPLSVKTGAPLSQKRKRKQPEPLPLAARIGPRTPAPPDELPPPPPSSPPPPPPPPAPPAPAAPAAPAPPQVPVRVPPRAIHPLNAHLTHLSNVQDTVHFLALPAFRDMLVPGAKPWLRTNWPVPPLPGKPPREKPHVLSFAIVFTIPEDGMSTSPSEESGAPDPSTPSTRIAAGAIVTKTLTDADFDLLDSLFLHPSAGISGEIPASPAPAVPVFTIMTGAGTESLTYTDRRWRSLKLVYDAVEMSCALGVGVWLSNGRRSVRCSADGASGSFGTRADGVRVEEKREEEAGCEAGEIVEHRTEAAGGPRRGLSTWTDGVYALMVGDAFWAMRK